MHNDLAPEECDQVKLSVHQPVKSEAFVPAGVEQGWRRRGGEEEGMSIVIVA